MTLENKVPLGRYKGFPGDASGKEPTSQCRRCKKSRFNPWVRKIPWRRTRQPMRIPWTEEPGGLRSMALQSRIQLKQLSTHTHPHPQEEVHTCRFFLRLSPMYRVGWQKGSAGKKETKPPPVTLPCSLKREWCTYPRKEGVRRVTKHPAVKYF